MPKILKLVFLFSIIYSYSYSQRNKQNLGGTINDKLTQYPLVGVSVHLEGQNISKNVLSDSLGNYLFKDLDPGYYNLQFQIDGYKQLAYNHLEVFSGKETLLEIVMEENVKKINELVVKSSNNGAANNKFATISSRSISPEEINSYAGGRSDIARLVANYAGVSVPNDSRNDIVIRGNSPVGVLWKIDGLTVTNPNHFATVGTTGGAVSAINTNMLKSSDFFTSAWPAEYGNAISGVFDIGFRNGNSKKYEYTFQLGLITGLEALAEGPIKKGNGSSFLIGYRYSLAGIAQAAGVNIGTTALPSYQDLSFKINSGNTSFGKFSLFGILAKSAISLTSNSSNSSNTLYSVNNNTDFSSKIGIIGLKHTYQFNSKSYLNTGLGLSYSYNLQTQDSTLTTGAISLLSNEKVTQSSINLSSNYNLKINTRFFIRLGVQYDITKSILDYTKYKSSVSSPIWNTDRYTQLASGYFEIKYNLNDNLVFNGGLHAQKFFLNSNSIALEPRLSILYKVSDKSRITLGYGLHSQEQPINIYFNENPNGSINTSNFNLGFNRSEHFVLSYDYLSSSNWRIKAEIYYQHLYDIAVDSSSSSYSMLNTGADFKPDLSINLVNKGYGKNYGFEFTVEKFLKNGFYGLISSSIYQAKYSGSDGVERNSAFNGKYTINFLIGKEFKRDQEGRKHFNLDFKLTSAGGRYFTPSGGSNSSSLAFSSEYPNYFRMDFKMGYTFNSKNSRLSQSWSIDVQNITNHKNVYTANYNQRTGQYNYNYQLGLFPNFIYKIEF